jgi:hypothetical protein
MTATVGDICKRCHKIGNMLNKCIAWCRLIFNNFLAFLLSEQLNAIHCFWRHSIDITVLLLTEHEISFF